MKIELCLPAIVLALTTACGDTPTEGTASAGATDGQATATDSAGSFTDATPGSNSDSDSDSPTSAPTSGVSNSGNSDPSTGDTQPADTESASASVDSVDTTNATPATPGTGDTEPDPDTTTPDTADTTAGLDDTGDDTTTGGTDTNSDDTTGTPPDPCEAVLHAVIRDFQFSHPDFEDFGGNVAYTGLVQPDLGPDMKPVYAHPGPTPQTSGPDAFKQWYNDTPNVNQTFMVDLPLNEVQPGLYQFADNSFFPIDNQGFGNEGQGNNFAFTTEIHTTFVYNGGETFTFTGDDDVWVFINGKLAIDLGGLHPELTDSVDLDAAAAMLGISPGNVYAMDLFHAERHTTQSNFRIDTTIGCFTPQ